MRTLLLLLAFVSSCASAAQPAVTGGCSALPHRTSGTAPLAVLFQGNLVTQTGNTTPFHTLLYQWTFTGGGISSSSTYTYGANAGQSKNFQKGPIASYVFDTTGTWTLVVTDGTSAGTLRCTGTITVTPANTTYSTTNTTCFYNSSVGSGCPSGATQTQSSDFDAALAACLTGTNKRCLFKGGDTFVANANTDWSSAGPAQIGAYGTGRAKVTWTGATSTLGFIRVSGTGSDLRVTDIEFDGTGTVTQTWMAFQNTAWTNVLIQGNYAHDLCNFLNGADWAGSGGSGLFILSNRIENPEAACSFDSTLISGGDIAAVLDNNYSQGGLGQQVLRINNTNKYRVSDNTFAGALAGKETVGVRSNASRSSTYGVISGNSVSVGPGYTGIYPRAQAATLGVFDVIVEGNYIFGASAAADTDAIEVNAERVSIRNNILYAATSRMKFGIDVLGTNGGFDLASKDVWVYNNTLFVAAGPATYSALIVDSTASTGIQFKNNLVYSSAITATVISDSGGVATKGNNTCDADGCTMNVTTNPFRTTPTSTLTTYEPSTSAYAYNGGTVLYPATASDFFNCFDKTAAQYRIGAVVTRSLAICVGAP